MARRRFIVYISPMSKPARSSNTPLLILMIAMIAVVAVAGVSIWRITQAGPAAGASSGVDIGGPFTLTDQSGAAVTDKTYDGSYRLIYFGYTFCPDACPTELGVMAQAIETMGPAGQKVLPIFITIDPDRDTVQQLKTYVPLFDKRLVGLTGTPQQIAAVAKAYKVYYAKADQPGVDTKSYGMNHSSFVYLMDPNGKFLTVFSSDTDSDKMAAEIRRYMDAPAS
ncbi:MAG TPA: SCO family protein [Alphaproteobacteria bacterium]|nr:SCO family protein [Alphaproteobacteria bacterium]